ncbi:MAG TPA: helix-turn-helix transcriptional regulator [Candidatus Coproplasma stercoravium]|nr:helix-turn-helix transcriptional regulator [Candidatus Coproplasma stercoravium]
MTLAEALSVRINQLMQERNLTQYKLAQLSGLAETTVADIRKMRNKGTNIQNINAIAQGLEIDLTEFFNSPLFSRENITD